MEDHDAQLRRYAQEAGSELEFEEISTNDKNRDNRFTVRAVLNGKAYANGVGKTKDEATQDAARIALSQVMERDQRKPVNPTEAAKRRSFGGKSSKWTDYIRIVTKYCIEKGKILNFLVTDIRGPQHMREFWIKVMINDKDYPEGVGKTKKEAQQKAAELAWSALQEQSDFDSKVSVFSTKSRDSTSTTTSPSAATVPAELSPHSVVSNARRLLKPPSSAQEPLMSALSVDSAPTEPPPSNSLASLPTLSQSLPISVDFVGISDPSNAFQDQIPLKSSVSVDSDPSRSLVDLTQNVTAVNYVSKLNEHAQKTHALLKYEDVPAVGPDHIKTFSARVVVNGKPYPEGVGNNKKEAKQNAAKNALRVLVGLVDVRENVEPFFTASVPPLRTNYISWLNEYGHKEKVAVKYVEAIEPGPSFAQSCKFVIGGKEYPTGKGKTKKEAKEEAAKLAYHEICSSRTTETEDEKSTGTSFPQEEELRQSATESSDTSRRLSMKKEDEGFIEPNVIIMFEESKEQESPQVQLDCNSKVISSLSTPTSWDRSSESAPSSSSDIFTESSSSSKEQQQDSSKNENMGKGTKETSTHSRFASEFDSIECLGKGGFGHVHKARHKLMNEHFAIKIVRYREKVLKEVKALLKLPHPNIVRYFHCWKEDTEYQCENATGSHSSTLLSSSTSTAISYSSPQYLYIQMELCEMKTLKDWINDKNKETLPSSIRAAQSRPIALQIVCGVECIHQRFIHRDLKPANIMFGQDGQVKIGDFGLVTTEMDDDENQQERTEEAGTPSYMAPEQKNKTYDNKVDIFALGLIYLELLWKMSSVSEKAAVFTKAKGQMLPEDFSQTFPQESKIIIAMLSENPKQRPEARDLRAEMEKK